MNGTSVSSSCDASKCASARSPGVSSYEYQSNEKSLAPTGIRHSPNDAPTPGANSSRRMPSRSCAVSSPSAAQPSSLKQAPKPSISCCGSSTATITSGMAVGAARTGGGAARHGSSGVVTVQVVAFMRRSG